MRFYNVKNSHISSIFCIKNHKKCKIIVITLKKLTKNTGQAKFFLLYFFLRIRGKKWQNRIDIKQELMKRRAV